MKLSVSVVSVSLMLVTVVGLGAQSTKPALIGPPRVRSFPRLDYPPVARTARVQGAVVVRATLTANGEVPEAVALSGPAIISEAAVAHARRLSFANAPDTIILVYLFEIDGACTGPDTFFRWGNAPNVIRITTCSAVDFG